ncbi:MAG: FHA domain-containing protein [Rhodobacteraceae bacterium]|nr:FHA domain-containing protein [Paracoccaceae bacterium]
MGVLRQGVLAAIMGLGMAGAALAQAQEILPDGTLPTRLPDTGLAVVDCAPAPPVPVNHCIVRVPPRQQYGGITFDNAEDPEARFVFLRGSDPQFPEALNTSATAILIDYTRGAGNGRANRWDEERPFILSLINSLPDGEQVAVYTFDTTLTEIVGFTGDRARVRNAVANLDAPDGLNTIIGSNVADVVDLLGRRDDVLLRNVIVISDGEDEATDRSAAEIAEAAVDEGVAISTMAVIWRAPGATAVSNAIDYMAQLAAQSLGSHAAVFLNTPEAAAAEVAQFGREVAGSISQSGLIAPVGTPSPAEIVVTLGEPVAGRSGAFDDVEYRVAFQPTIDMAPETAPTDAPVDAREGFLGFPWGFPAEIMYGALAVLAVLLALLIVVLTRSSRGAEEEDVVAAEGAFDDGDAVEDDETTVPPAAAPPPKPWAFLVRQDTGQRLALIGRKSRIGRSPENDVLFEGPEDQTVSRFHAEIERRANDQIILTDLNSTNKVRLNGKVIDKPEPLKNGDLITFGSRETKLIIR